jgi:hypothetical protein
MFALAYDEPPTRYLVDAMLQQSHLLSPKAVFILCIAALLPTHLCNYGARCTSRSQIVKSAAPCSRKSLRGPHPVHAAQVVAKRPMLLVCVLSFGFFRDRNYKAQSVGHAVAFTDRKENLPHRHLQADCLEIVGASTSHNPKGLHSLLPSKG